MEVISQRLTMMVVLLVIISCSVLVQEAKGHHTGKTPEQLNEEAKAANAAADPECEKKEFLDLHNKYRAEMNLPPFCWNETVAAFANEYAQLRLCDCDMVHSQQVGFKKEMCMGENLAKGNTADLSIHDAVKMWYDEKPHYDYETNQCRQMCGHYTQIVWKKSTQLGCKKIRCLSGDGSTLITCNYYPPGNVVGQKPF